MTPVPYPRAVQGSLLQAPGRGEAPAGSYPREAPRASDGTARAQPGPPRSGFPQTLSFTPICVMQVPDPGPELTVDVFGGGPDVRGEIPNSPQAIRASNGGQE